MRKESIVDRKLTKKEAINLFRQLWTDMRTELGDCPDFVDRRLFKGKWCRKNFPDESIMSNCPLCEYAHQRHVAAGEKGYACRFCPIGWPARPFSYGTVIPDCQGLRMHYLIHPISEILALPEREVPNDTNETI